MKLSLKKRLGALHVRGGRVVTVAHDHQVSTLGADRKRGVPDEKWVTATVGDIAIEIVAHRTGQVMGHAYLSGAAVTLHRYGPCAAHWHKETTGWRVSLAPAQDRPFKEQHVDLISRMARCKYSGIRLAVFEEEADSAETVSSAAKIFAEVFRGEFVDPATGQPLEWTAHVLGHIFHKKTHVGVHFQPPKEATPQMASSFQIELALSSPELVAVDLGKPSDNRQLEDWLRPEQFKWLACPTCGQDNDVLRLENDLARCVLCGYEWTPDRSEAGP